jgi:UDP-N-acetylmuramate--alanine ligase
MRLEYMKNKTISPNTSIHFIGCGGIGMCGLAMLSMQFGCKKVSGSDVQNSKNTKLLQASGADIYIGHLASNLPKKGTFIVVYSSAIQSDNPELREAQKRGIKCYKRGEYLALIAKQYKRVVSVAGSHGKTTVTAMIVHILKQFLDIDPGYLIGGWPVGWKSLGETGNGDIFVIEADESDLSLTLLFSHIGTVLNLDDDHSWNVGGKDKLKKGFIKFAEQSNLLLYTSDKELDNIFQYTSVSKKIIDFENKLNNPEWNQTESLWGKYQKKNAIMAIATAVELGISQKEAFEAIRTFRGVERRMQKIFSNNIITIFEDYAHHPVEVKVAIDAVREAYPDHKLTVIFQPHRYARLKYYLNEFTVDLKKADRVFIVPVFSAWSSTDKISSEDLAENIGTKAVPINGSWKNIAKKVMAENILEKNILLILGAGDVNSVISKIIETIGN